MATVGHTIAETAAVDTPGAGYITLYMDSADKHAKIKDSLGVVTDLTNDDIPWADLADYARGCIIRGGAVDWEAYDAKVDGAALVGDGTDILSDLTPFWKGKHTFEAGADILTNVGISIGAAGDADADLITVNVTGAPTLKWDESEDAFTLSKALRLPALPVHASDAASKEYVDQYAGWQGVSWNESTDVYTRRGSLAGLAAGSSPGDGVLPIQAAMRRCVLSDAGEVQYYLDANDSTKKADGSASDLTGADGQVMVEIPKFYYKYSYLSNVHTWDISYHERPGYIVHPAFVKNGAEVDYRYIGAYEGVLYDDSKSVYTSDYNQIASHSATFDVDDGTGKGTITAGSGTPYALLQAGDVIVVTGTADNNGTYIIDSVTDTVITCTTVIAGADGVEATTVISAPAVDTANDVLSSVTGKKPFTGITRANFRSIAANRGTGWRQYDFYLMSAIQLLYLVEYADFYSQSMIGNGLTDWASATWSAYNAYHPINNSGLSNSDGNGTNSVSNGDGSTGSYMTYRGIENWYGHIWKFVDGFNVNNNVPYFSNNDADFADDTATNYDAPGVTMHNANGYQGALEQIGEGFLPADVTGTSTTKITDYYWQAAGWRGARVGTYATNGAAGGGFALAVAYASGDAGASIGGRVCF